MEHKLSSDYIKIGYKAGEKFSRNINRTDLEDCVINGIHDAILKFDPNKGKISTLIYNLVTYNCKNYIRYNKKLKRKNYFEIKCKESEENMFDEEITEILLDRYVYRLPYKAICDKYNMSYEDARLKIKQNKKIFKKMVKSKKFLKH